VNAHAHGRAQREFLLVDKRTFEMVAGNQEHAIALALD
jgi:hypothetical protein